MQRTHVPIAKRIKASTWHDPRGQSWRSNPTGDTKKGTVSCTHIFVGSCSGSDIGMPRGGCADDEVSRVQGCDGRPEAHEWLHSHLREPRGLHLCAENRGTRGRRSSARPHPARPRSRRCAAKAVLAAAVVYRRRLAGTRPRQEPPFFFHHRGVYNSPCSLSMNVVHFRYETMHIKLPAHQCPKCKNVWAKRVEKPKKCPKCFKRLKK